MFIIGSALTTDIASSSPHPHPHLQVRVSYIEIYLEKIKDLLNPAQDNLNVREGGSATAGGPQRGVWIEGYQSASDYHDVTFFFITSLRLSFSTLHHTLVFYVHSAG